VFNAGKEIEAMKHLTLHRFIASIVQLCSEATYNPLIFSKKLVLSIAIF
jgi:hypothetical protein